MKLLTAEVVGVDDVALLGGRGERDDRHRVELRVTSDLAEYFDAIDPRQLEVEQDEARAFPCCAVRVLAAGKEESPGLRPVLDGDDVVDEPPSSSGPGS